MDAQDEEELATEGLLASVINEWRSEYLEEYKDWFELSRRLNRISLRLYMAHWSMPGERLLGLKATAHRIMGRAISSFAATVILCERAAALEAASVSRSISEASIWLGYLAEKPDEAMVALEDDHLHSLKSRYQELRRVSKESGHSERVEDSDNQIRIITEKLNGRKKPNWREIAQRYGSSQSYMKFRILSGHYSHLSQSSLNNHIVRADDKTAHHILGPHPQEIPHALYFACDALADCGSAYSAIVDDWTMAKEFFDIRPSILSLRDDTQSSK